MNATDTQVDDYAARVGAALADLPGAVRDELLADLTDHLAEVAGEDDGTDLETRLGPPETYAADLRAAAGLAPSRPASLRERARDWGDHPWVHATAAFLPELRPGWWVLRGVLMGFAVAVLPGFGPAAWIPLVAVGAVASVLLGRRAQRDTRWRLAGHLLSAVAVATAVLALFAAGSGSTAPPADWVYGPDGPTGNGFTNLYVYGPDGKPLKDVQIFDQDGNPVLPPSNTDPSGNLVETVPRYDPQGRVVPNVYPQEQTVTDYAQLDANGNGTVVRVTPPAVTPTPLAPR